MLVDHQASFRRFLPQPVVAIVTCSLACMALAATWAATPLAIAGLDRWQILILAVCFIAADVVADAYPIHVNYHTKATVSTIALYLTAVLLPLPLAACAAGLSHLIGETRHRDNGNLPSDIATSSARWVLIVLAGSFVAHLPPSAGLSQMLILVATGLVMFAGDIITSALELGPISGDRPLRVIRTVSLQVWRIEVVLYSLAIFGALAAATHLLALLFLIPPIWTAYLAFRRTTEVHEGTRQLLESMADAVDLRDPYTGGHSRRVTAFCEQILDELGYSGPDAELIVSAARVHDIGKIGIPDGVLNKPGALTPEERATMETHAALGADLLARYPDFARGVAIVRHHHERWDGQGYPDKKAGYDIPFGARVMAVADSYDAMTSDRPYRPGMAPARAAQILREGRGTQWDAALVDTFLQSIAVLHPETTASASAVAQSRPIATT